MSDDQFRKLRTLILDQSVEIKGLAVTVRALERKIVSLEAKIGAPKEVSADIYENDELTELLKKRPRREVKAKPKLDDF